MQLAEGYVIFTGRAGQDGVSDATPDASDALESWNRNISGLCTDITTFTNRAQTAYPSLTLRKGD